MGRLGNKEFIMFFTEIASLFSYAVVFEMVQQQMLTSICSRGLFQIFNESEYC
jgi:hypothetical protein